MPHSPRPGITQQLPLFEDDRLAHIINVASVPQCSVFRYPGGKTWLVPYIRQWLRTQSERPSTFIEPFAGGGIVGLTVAFENLAEHVTLVELDESVAAVWQTMLNDDAAWLADRILVFDLTAQTVEAELSRLTDVRREIAFQTILKNRVNRGGILAAGAGRIKNGESGKGLASRWYPATLSRRILEIAAIRELITFIAGDGMAIMRECADRVDAIYFIDPPYTAGGKRAGSRLYTHAALDHEALFALADTLAGNFLMTYDDAADVRTLAARYHFDVRAVPMKNTHHAQMNELLIGHDLSWLNFR